MSSQLVNIVFFVQVQVCRVVHPLCCLVSKCNVEKCKLQTSSILLFSIERRRLKFTRLLVSVLLKVLCLLEKIRLIIKILCLSDCWTIRVKKSWWGTWAPWPSRRPRTAEAGLPVRYRPRRRPRWQTGLGLPDLSAGLHAPVSNSTQRTNLQTLYLLVGMRKRLLSGLNKHTMFQLLKKR